MITLQDSVVQASAELTSGLGSMAAEEVVGNWLAMKEMVAAKQAQVDAEGVRQRKPKG